MTLKMALLGALTAALPLAASTLALDTGGTNVGAGLGNVRTFTSGSITVKVTAWGLTANSNTTFEAGQVGQFAGLGVADCNKSEGAGCGDPSHQVDNSGERDFLLIQFSSPVNLTGAVLHPYCGSGCPAGGWDRDVTYFTGVNLALNLSLTGLGLGTLPVGFNGGTEILNTPGGTLAIGLSGSGINSLLIGASSTNVDGLIDRFKLQSVSFDASTVPEPATLGTLGAALVALGMFARRRRKV